MESLCVNLYYFYSLSGLGINVKKIKYNSIHRLFLKFKNFVYIYVCVCMLVCTCVCVYYVEVGEGTMSIIGNILLSKESVHYLLYWQVEA